MPFPSFSFQTEFGRDSASQISKKELQALYAQFQKYLSVEHDSDGTHSDITCDSLTVAGRLLAPIPWVSVPWELLTFSASSGANNWAVEKADLVYYKYRRFDDALIIKGAITTSSVLTTAPTELRVSAPPGIVFAGNDSFGPTLYTDDAFATQDCGQAIARVDPTKNHIAFKHRDGSVWALSTNLTAVIWNFVVEL